MNNKETLERIVKYTKINNLDILDVDVRLGFKTRYWVDDLHYIQYVGDELKIYLDIGALRRSLGITDE